jgi:hypothetical protein
MTPGQMLNRINQNITDMKKKELLPKHTLGYFSQDKANLQKMLHETAAQTFKEWTCPVCQISVYGPKKLLLEHHKIHSSKREIRENETYEQNYRLY